MNTQLIADAVRNSRGDDESTVWDRLFAFWFRRLVYTQIWEDPEADLAALQLPLGSTIVTISSGGCNALSYLTAQPAQVYRGRSQRSPSFAAQAEARRPSRVLQAMPSSGSSSARPPRPPTPSSIATGCGRCWTPMRALTGTSATSSGGRAMAISPTDSIATACSAASSALPMCWRNLPGSICRPC